MRKATTKWHAVTVVLHETSCAAAALCRNRKHLSRDAPRLPLSACPHPELCPCTYRHFEDRRTGPRRNAEIGSGLADAKPKTNRRASPGRRANDRH